MREVVEELQMAMRSGPMPNPVLEKITPEHINQLLAADERDSERDQERYKLRAEERKIRLKLDAEHREHALDARSRRRRAAIIALCVLAVFVLVVVFALCWLFLGYGQPQYIVTVLSSIFAFAGGIGVGRMTVKSREPTPKPETPEEPQQ